MFVLEKGSDMANGSTRGLNHMMRNGNISAVCATKKAIISKHALLEIADDFIYIEKTRGAMLRDAYTIMLLF
ncbi:unnamed protein product [Urochloa humidicola]